MCSSFVVVWFFKNLYSLNYDFNFKSSLQEFSLPLHLQKFQFYMNFCAGLFPLLYAPLIYAPIRCITNILCQLIKKYRSIKIYEKWKFRLSFWLKYDKIFDFLEITFKITHLTKKYRDKSCRGSKNSHFYFFDFFPNRLWGGARSFKKK